MRTQDTLSDTPFICLTSVNYSCADLSRTRTLLLEPSVSIVDQESEPEDVRKTSNSTLKADSFMNCYRRKEKERDETLKVKKLFVWLLT